MDSETNSTVKHSVGFWAAVVAQWFYAICAGTMALGIVTGVIVQIATGGEILVCLVVLPHLAFFTWTAWLSGKLARNIQRGIQPPSASLSMNWGSALTITILTALVSGLFYTAIRQLRRVDEKVHVSEALAFIHDVDSKQKAFNTKHGKLPATTSEIGPMLPLKYFTLDYVKFENKPSNWNIKLTRNDFKKSSNRYGNYAIVYTFSGTPHYDCVDSSHLKACREELLPQE